MRIAAALAALGLLAVVPAGTAAKRAPCAAKHSRTVLATQHARIFQKVDSRGLRVSYACLYKTDRRWRLSNHDDVNGDTAIFPKALAGRYAGFAVTHCPGPGGEDCISRVRVMDLTNGRGIHAAKAFRGKSNDFFTDSLVVAANGDVAWIAESDDPAEAFEVRKATPDGVKLLDAGPNIAEDSLARAGNRIYWTRGGVAKSARLR